jgi:methylphosphotriester-DNA--protein-cysteine methyltransferase
LALLLGFRLPRNFRLPYAAADRSLVAKFETILVYNYTGNRNTKKFHLPSCSYLPDPENRVYFTTREQAINAGYTPCGHCRP